MGLFRVIADAVYKEYDRRIKRASLVTEYGAHHHADAHAADEHVADTHAQAERSADAHADEDEAEIINLPRGTPMPLPAPATVENQEPRTEDERIEDRG